MTTRYIYSISALCRITGQTWPRLQVRLKQLGIEPAEVRDDMELWYSAESLERILAYLEEQKHK